MTDDTKPASTYRLQITNHTLTPRGIHEVDKINPTVIEAKGGTGFVTVNEGTKNQLVAMDDDTLFFVYVLEKDGKSLGKRKTTTRAEREEAARENASAAGQAAAAAAAAATEAANAAAATEAQPAPIGNPTAFLLSKGMPQAEIDDLGGEDEIAARAEGLGWTRPEPEGVDDEDAFDETQFDDYDVDGLRAYLTGQKVEFHPQTGETKLRLKALEHARAAHAAPAEEAV